MLAPEFNLFGMQTTTHPCALLCIVQGPVVGELEKRDKEIGQLRRFEKYRSEFFARLASVFEGTPDIKVVGDRFVFPHLEQRVGEVLARRHPLGIKRKPLPETGRGGFIVACP